MMLVMRPHRVLHAGVGIVGVLHGDVAVAVAGLRGSGRRGGVARVLLLLYQAALVLVVFEAGGWVRLRLGSDNVRLGLSVAVVIVVVVVVVSRGHLASAVVSPRAP